MQLQIRMQTHILNCTTPFPSTILFQSTLDTQVKIEQLQDLANKQESKLQQETIDRDVLQAKTVRLFLAWPLPSPSAAEEESGGSDGWASVGWPTAEGGSLIVCACVLAAYK